MFSLNTPAGNTNNLYQMFLAAYETTVRKLEQLSPANQISFIGNSVMLSLLCIILLRESDIPS